MIAPKYYLSVLGDPKPPGKDTVESGIYHPDPKYAPFPTKPGDILLLYCTSSYIEHAMRVPGIGVVLETKSTEIHYRYLQLSRPISKYDLDNNFDLEDKNKFSNIRFSSHWLFEISRQSFGGALGDRAVVWP